MSTTVHWDTHKKTSTTTYPLCTSHTVEYTKKYSLVLNNLIIIDSKLFLTKPFYPCKEILAHTQGTFLYILTFIPFRTDNKFLFW